MTKEMAIDILRGDVLGTNEQTHEAVFMAIKALKAEPVKHGRVIDGKCSVCNHKMNAWACDFVYCPYCKAKMGEVKEDE